MGTVCVDTDIPGYIILRPQLQASQFSLLGARCLAELGEAISVLEAAIIEQAGAEHVYVLRFSEALSSVHFHMLPRTAALRLEFSANAGSKGEGVDGPLLYSWARRRFAVPGPQHLSPRTLEVARQIRLAVEAQGPGP